jgi:uncharacterized membrane protein
LEPTKKQKWIMRWTLVFFGIIYLAIPIVNHYFFRTYCYDYGVYNQAFYDFAHARVNHNTIIDPPLTSFMQIHVAFLLYIIAPAYWLIGWLTGTYTLLIVQSLVIIAGGYAVYKLVLEQAKDFLIALLAMIHYFLLLGHYSAISSDYTDTTVGASLIPFFLLYLFRKKALMTSIFFLLILLTKENMAIWLAFISLAIMLMNRKDKFLVRAGATYLGISLCYFVFCYPALVHLFEDPQKPYAGFAYSALGNSPGAAIGFMISHPLKTIELLYNNPTGVPEFNFYKIDFYLVVLFSGAFMVYRKPLFLLMLLPIVLQKVFNDSWVRWGNFGFYTIEIVSILSICVFLSVAAIKNPKWKTAMSTIVILSTLTMTILKIGSGQTNPDKENILSYGFYHSPLNVREVHDGLTLIPEDASVAASEVLVPHLAFRPEIHCFPFVHESEYIALLKNSSCYPLQPEEFKTYMADYRKNAGWEIIYDTRDMVMFHRKKR